MPVQSYKMGPGTLILNPGATPTDLSCQITNCTVAATENVESGETVPLLCGENLTGDDTVSLSWELSGNLVQDLTAAGVVEYTWTNATTVVPFAFVPSTAAGRQVTGSVRLVPLSIGGDVQSRPQSDFTWSVIGTPTLGAVA